MSSRKAEACWQVAAELSRTGECLALPADLSTEEACRRLAAEVAEREDRVQVLVNNAGATWGRRWRTTGRGLGQGPGPEPQAPFFLTWAMLPLLEAAAASGDPAR